MARSNAQYAGRKLVIAAAVAALLGTEAYAAPAGSVDFSVGNVMATGPDGRARPLAKGAELNSGDRIVTNDGRAQIRFADGAYVSLQPNTDFAIREYRYDGRTDGSERGLFGLLKGAMRTVTGAIGRVNRSAYEIQTPTATIGIRGTGGLIQVFDDGRTLLRGSSGVWTIAGLDKKNVIDVPGGQAAMTFPDPQKAPEMVSEGPVLPPAPLVPVGEAPPTILGGAGSPPMAPIAGDIAEAAIASEWPIPPGTIPPGIFENASTIATPSNPNPPLVSGPGQDLSYASGGVAPFTANDGQVTATYDAAGKLTSWTGPTGTATLNGTQAEFGTAGGALAWGRWTGPIASTITQIPPQTYGANDGLHYVNGIPAPITALGGSGTATFDLIGATSPTDGVNTPGAVTGGQIVANLGAAPTANLQNFTFTHSGSTYIMNKAGMPITGPFTPFNGTLGSADFAGSTGACQFTICSAQVNGHFYGANASHAGFAYQVTGGGPTISGAAAFAR
jgi:YD repeat-containing protein